MRASRVGDTGAGKSDAPWSPLYLEVRYAQALRAWEKKRPPARFYRGHPGVFLSRMQDPDKFLHAFVHGHLIFVSYHADGYPDGGILKDFNTHPSQIQSLEFNVDTMTRFMEGVDSPGFQVLPLYNDDGDVFPDGTNVPFFASPNPPPPRVMSTTNLVFDPVTGQFV